MMDLKFTTAGDYMKGYEEDIKACPDCGGFFEEEDEIQIEFHHIYSLKKKTSDWKAILGDKFAGKNLKRIFELDENVIKRLGEEVLQHGLEENRFRVTMDDGSNYEILIK